MIGEVGGLVGGNSVVLEPELNPMMTGSLSPHGVRQAVAVTH